MSDPFVIGLLIGAYSPILLIAYIGLKKIYKIQRNKHIDAKRRKTFKIVQSK